MFSPQQQAQEICFRDAGLLCKVVEPSDFLCRKPDLKLVLSLYHRAPHRYLIGTFTSSRGEQGLQAILP